MQKVFNIWLDEQVRSHRRYTHLALWVVQATQKVYSFDQVGSVNHIEGIQYLARQVGQINIEAILIWLGGQCRSRRRYTHLARCVVQATQKVYSFGQVGSVGHVEGIQYLARWVVQITYYARWVVQATQKVYSFGYVGSVGHIEGILIWLGGQCRPLICLGGQCRPHRRYTHLARWVVQTTQKVFL